MRSSLQWLLGGATGLVVGSGCYWLVGDPILAAVSGLVWGVGLALTARSARHHPSSTGVTNWRSARWIGLGVAGINLAALIGVSPSLPISAELRLALGLLIIGTGLLATATATLAEVERQGDTATTTEPNKATTAGQSIE
ncbi:sterol desaturase [Halonotius aquaticus]|uniref:Sterol desaturase n=1 Tax=Halonotius aquaticus TaxID=2216978 RepID=A0A3A6QDW2_9EURY|nr:sterol desaturase [Halonotius aquaticus]RJX44270.1 sterol desaturase [Halonotius aquaticus]